MRLMLCHSSLKPLRPPRPPLNVQASVERAYRTLIRTAVTLSLSLTFTIAPPISAIALETPPSIVKPMPAAPYSDSSKSFVDSSETCSDDTKEEDEAQEKRDDEFVTNEEIVEEAWQIVNESFLGAGGRPWNPETWQNKKKDILAAPIQTRSKAHDLIKQMLASLGDPYTRFLSPAEFSKMSKYDITGIGLNLREVPDNSGSVKLRVLGIVLDGPADSAGVRQGDEILAVNGVDVSGKSAFEVSSLLQGPSKTFVALKVKHGNCGPVRSIKVQRQINAQTPVFYRLERIGDGGNSVGYILIKEFNALARKDLVTAMKRLQDMGASYFIMDLRDNPGGLVQAGIETAKIFLEEGETVTYTARRDLGSQQTIVADASPLITAPVVVLVNNRTASASEIVASALHDNCRAVLVGERTYGKGLIQSVFELQDGSGLAVTIGKYVTPNRTDINGNGLKPDYRKLPDLNEVKQHLSNCNKLRQS